MRTGTALGGRRSAAVVLAVWVLVLAIGAVAARMAPAWLADTEVIREFFLGFGYLAPVAFVLVLALQVVVAPLPGQVLGFVAGYLFGAVWGAILSLTGTTIGTYIAVRLARHFGRPAVQRLIHPDTIDKFDAAVDQRGLVALFVVFLVPGLPDDAICFAAGLTRIDVKRILLVSIIGRLPGYVLVSLAGARLAGGHPTDTVAILGAIAVLSIGVYVFRGTLTRWLSGDGDAPSVEPADPANVRRSGPD